MTQGGDKGAICLPHNNTYMKETGIRNPFRFIEYELLVCFFYVVFLEGFTRMNVEKTNYIEVVIHCRYTCSRYSKISGAG